MIRSILRAALYRAACIPAALAIGGLDRRLQRANAEADRHLQRARAAQRPARDAPTSDALEMARAELQLLRGALAKMRAERDHARAELTACREELAVVREWAQDRQC